MARKAAVAGIAAIAMFYLVTSPVTAAGAVKTAGVGMQHVVHQISVFLKAMV